jgi:hypothetical protein
MNPANVILRGFIPYFFAISWAFSFIAARCGAAISLALSYVIAPAISHILMLFISSVCFIVSLIWFSLYFDITAGGFILQGEIKKYFKKNGVENGVKNGRLAAWQEKTD